MDQRPHKFVILVKDTGQEYDIVDDLKDSFLPRLPSMHDQFEVVRYTADKVLTPEEVDAMLAESDNSKEADK